MTHSPEQSETAGSGKSKHSYFLRGPMKQRDVTECPIMAKSEREVNGGMEGRVGEKVSGRYETLGTCHCFAATFLLPPLLLPLLPRRAEVRAGRTRGPAGDD